MKSVKYCLLLCCAMFAISADAQQMSALPRESYDIPGFSETNYLNGKQSHLFNGLRTDPVINYRYPAPWFTFWPGNSGNLYWLGSTTTQSFNQGKFGTIYFYDMLGNLRFASPFIDIAGKNKRGLKLLLPTINQRMFVSH